MTASASPRKRAGRKARLDQVSGAEGEVLRKLGKKYRILAQLGEGGTAKVWLALARGPSGFNKLVVLKTIRGELLDDPSVVVMFLEEARLAARLNHPNIVQTNEVFEQDHHPVIVMEFLDGLPFSAVLERQREGNAMALAMLLRILSDALAGLHAAHDLTDYDGTKLSVVHRDVSPHNLFVTFTGQVKVLDFGIAQLSNSGGATESGVIKGKLRYIAPEQIQGESPVDCRADVYSMGVILWEVAAAERMWAKVQEVTIMRRILSGDLPKVRDVNPDVDTDLVRIIEKALATHPADRYATALEFQTDLDQYLVTLGSSLRNRDIGRALSKMFEDVREERSRMIENQLARSDTLYDIQLNQAPLPELTSFSNVPRGPTRNRTLPLATPALVLLALLAMLAFALVLAFVDRPPAHNLDQPEHALAAAESEEHETPHQNRGTIVLRVTAYPRDARITLDGVVLSSNPHIGRLPKDSDNAHSLLVEAVGYRSEERHLLLSHDQELVLHLHQLETPQHSDVTESTSNEHSSKVPAPREVSSPRPSKAPPKKVDADNIQVPSPTQESAPPQTNCKPPFYYDERGIKKYRPECL